jgi:GT2 family glycosyltransferase
VNYPSSEYLQLPFLDLVCFNAYLESQVRFAAYLARLHNIAGDRPLIMSEIGLDSLRHGEHRQAKLLGCQIRTAFASGCAGAFVYAWTDEWYRSGEDVEDWAFGLTRRDRRPKRALAAVRKAFAEVPFPPDRPCPRISVVLCTYNGGRVIRDCLEGLRKLDYPNFEVIVVNDGSTDDTAAVLGEYDFRVITTENRGLSNARNTGMEAATGEIVAYLDDDAYPDPHWLAYLAATFCSTTHAAVGGPNIGPPGDGWFAESVANAPGNPAHVLVSDREAEHIPGCNMAVRKAALQAVGGFDPQFRVAGDDVDLCWRLRERGETLGFSPAAMVWHHRRSSVRAFWRQQVGYGRAESLLERKWPEKYNLAGHTSWSGRVYCRGLTRALFPPSRIYYGRWGSAPFQRLCEPPAGGLLALPLMPEWYLVIVALLALSALGTLWTPLLFALPLAACAVALPLVQAGVSAARAPFSSAARSGAVERLRLRGLTAFLHLLQPLARLRGRLAGGLTPWRRIRPSGLEFPRPRAFRVWTERWQAHEERLRSLNAALRANQAIVQAGGEYDRWDLEIRGGMFGATRVLMAVEEHGHGTQLVRLRAWPRCSPLGVALTLVFASLSTAAAIDPSWPVSVILGMAALLPALRTVKECAASMAAIRHTLRQSGFESVR